MPAGRGGAVLRAPRGAAAHAPNPQLARAQLPLTELRLAIRRCCFLIPEPGLKSLPICAHCPELVLHRPLESSSTI
jgi:hypothetical protein